MKKNYHGFKTKELKQAWVSNKRRVHDAEFKINAGAFNRVNTVRKGLVANNLPSLSSSRT